MNETFVCVDLGASSTRVRGETLEVGILPNNVYDVSMDYVNRLDGWNSNAEDEAVFKQSIDISITKTAGEDNLDHFPMRALVGSVGERANAMANERPTALRNKHVQKINYANAITAIVYQLVRDNGLDRIGETEYDVNLYIALPPVELAMGEAIMKSQLTGTYSISLCMLHKEITLNIKEVKCFAESFMAITSFFFNTDGRPKDEARKYANGNLLSLDIGASSTDLAAVKNRKFLESTGATFKIGGNNVRDIVKKEIASIYGYEPDDVTAEQALAEGRLQFGSTYKDISHIVVEAKMNVSKFFMSNISNYFKNNNMPLQSFVGIVVSGGGSMQSEFIDDENEEVVTSKPMGEYLAEMIHETCDTVDVMCIADNPRMANINGLYVRAMVDKLVKERAAK